MLTNRQRHRVVDPVEGLQHGGTEQEVGHDDTDDGDAGEDEAGDAGSLTGLPRLGLDQPEDAEDQRQDGQESEEDVDDGDGRSEDGDGAKNQRCDGEAVASLGVPGRILLGLWIGLGHQGPSLVACIEAVPRSWQDHPTIAIVHETWSVPEARTGACVTSYSFC
jgi:hypothetical protein